MRVLMFGWEFPPFQAGGLATATLGLVKGLLNRGIEVTLVVPLLAVPPLPKCRTSGSRTSAADPRPGLRSIRVDSPLAPYAGAEEYRVLAELGTGGTPAKRRGIRGRPVRGGRAVRRRSRSGSPARSRTT